MVGKLCTSHCYLVSVDTLPIHFIFVAARRKNKGWSQHFSMKICFFAIKLLYIQICLYICVLKFKIALDKEFQYYLTNRDELIKKYLGKYIIIKDETVVGVYDTEIEAYTNGMNKFSLGTFLIQQCLPCYKNYTQTFHSRVIFCIII